MMADDGTRPTILSEKVLIPAGIVGSVIAAVVSFALWLNGQFVEVKQRIDRIEFVTRDRWTASDQKIWELEFSKHNPTINCPDTWDIIQQRKANEARFRREEHE